MSRRGLIRMNSNLCISRLSFALGVTVACLFSSASALATTNDPCKVLSAEKFSQIMGYAATIDKAASTPMTCFYQGPNHTGGQFMILTESASGPQADAMLNRRGATPPPGSGLIGGSYRHLRVPKSSYECFMPPSGFLRFLISQAWTG